MVTICMATLAFFQAWNLGLAGSRHLHRMVCRRRKRRPLKQAAKGAPRRLNLDSRDLSITLSSYSCNDLLYFGETTQTRLHITLVVLCIHDAQIVAYLFHSRTNALLPYKGYSCAVHPGNCDVKSLYYNAALHVPFFFSRSVTQSKDERRVRC
jgi:hypothetical protein